MALAEMEEAHREGLRYAADCDLQSFFDTVNHRLLMNRLARRIDGPARAAADWPLPARRASSCPTAGESQPSAVCRKAVRSHPCLPM